MIINLADLFKWVGWLLLAFAVANVFLTESVFENWHQEHDGHYAEFVRWYEQGDLEGSGNLGVLSVEDVVGFSQVSGAMVMAKVAARHMQIDRLPLWHVLVIVFLGALVATGLIPPRYFRRIPMRRLVGVLRLVGLGALVFAYTRMNSIESVFEDWRKEYDEYYADSWECDKAISPNTIYDCMCKEDDGDNEGKGKVIGLMRVRRHTDGTSVVDRWRMRENVDESGKGAAFSVEDVVGFSRASDKMVMDRVRRRQAVRSWVWLAFGGLGLAVLAATGVLIGRKGWYKDKEYVLL